MLKNLISRWMLYALFTLDVGGLALAYMLFGPLIINNPIDIVDPNTSLATRNIIVGLLFAAYPLTQFFASMLYGEFSDRLGRRPILLITSLVTALTFILSGIAISVRSITLLFVSRLLCGLGAGNVSVAQAGAADVTERSKLPIVMGFFPVLGGLSWVLAPLFAAATSNAKIVSWFNFATPFYFFGILVLVCFLGIYFLYRPISKKNTHVDLNLGDSFKNIFAVFNIKPVFYPLIASFIAIFGWTIYQSFSVPFLIEKFHINFDWLSVAFSYFAGSWLIGAMVGAHILFRFFKPARVVLSSMILSILFLLSFVITNHLWIFWYAAGGSNFFQAIVIGGFFSVFALLAKTNQLGRIFGTWNAALAFSSLVGPVVGGYLENLGINMPIVGATVIFVIAIVIFAMWFLDKQKNTMSNPNGLFTFILDVLSI